MIYYATKETLQRYKLKTPEQFESEMAPLVQAVVNRERGNRLFEWGCKLFYFDRRKCLQIMHYETKVVIFLVDLKVKDLENVGDLVAHYLLDMYSGDLDMEQTLKNYFAAAPLVCFDRITDKSDKSIITSLNGIQSRWAWDGYRFYEYIKDGILYTIKINRDVNEMPQTRKVNGKEEWIFPYELFAQTIKEHFGDNTNLRFIETKC